MIRARGRNTGKRSIRLSAAVLALAVAGVIGLTGCGGTPGLDSYETDFKSADEIKNWKKSDTGRWEIRDGALVGDARNIAEQRSILWLDKPVPQDLELEYTAVALDKPADLNCFICGNGHSYSGYEIIIGGFLLEGGKAAIYEARSEGDPTERKRLGREPFALEKGRTYHIKVRKDRGTFHLYVDDELLMTETDKSYEREGETYFGFSTFENIVQFDNLKITRKR